MARKRRLAFDDMLAIARRGAADSLASGIATTADYSFSGAAARAADELGLRAIVYLEVFASDPGEAERQFRATRSRRAGDRARPHSACRRTRRTRARVEVYRWCLSLGIPVGTHLAESANENEWLEHGTGPLAVNRARPRRTHRAGAPSRRSRTSLGPELLCAHCVEVEPDEIALLAERDVPVAHCPRSNAVLGCGIAPLTALRAAGVRVGLGTDSPASTPSFDMFEELRAAVYAARARERRPDALHAAEALRLATLDAARALRLERRGRYPDSREARRPDRPVARREPVRSRRGPGGRGRLRRVARRRFSQTIVDGQTRYRRGETEWQEVLSTASAARRQMLRPPTP